MSFSREITPIVNSRHELKLFLILIRKIELEIVFSAEKHDLKLRVLLTQHEVGF